MPKATRISIAIVLCALAAQVFAQGTAASIVFTEFRLGGSSDWRPIADGRPSRAELIGADYQAEYRAQIDPRMFRGLQAPAVRVEAGVYIDETRMNGSLVGSTGLAAPRAWDRVLRPVIDRTYPVPLTLIESGTSELTVLVVGPEWDPPKVPDVWIGEQANLSDASSRTLSSVIAIESAVIALLAGCLILTVSLAISADWNRPLLYFCSYVFCFGFSTAIDSVGAAQWGLAPPHASWLGYLIGFGAVPAQWLALRKIAAIDSPVLEFSALALFLGAMLAATVAESALVATLAVWLLLLVLLGGSITIYVRLFGAWRRGNEIALPLLIGLAPALLVTPVLAPPLAKIGSVPFYPANIGVCGTLIGACALLISRYHKITNDLVRLTSAQFDTQEQERARIAQALHDDFGQRLTTAKLALKRSQRRGAELDEEIELVEDLLTDTHRLVHDLRPSVLDRLGLQEAIARDCELLDESSTCAVVFHGQGGLRPEPRAEIHLFRIYQQAIRNALEHAEAQNIVVTLRVVGSRLTLSVADDGVGLSNQPRGKGGLGLSGMRQRARFLGGDLKFVQPRGGGTRIALEIPV